MLLLVPPIVYTRRKKRIQDGWLDWIENNNDGRQSTGPPGPPGPPDDAAMFSLKGLNGVSCWSIPTLNREQARKLPIAGMSQTLLINCKELNGLVGGREEWNEVQIWGQCQTPNKDLGSLRPPHPNTRHSEGEARKNTKENEGGKERNWERESSRVEKSQLGT